MLLPQAESIPPQLFTEAHCAFKLRYFPDSEGRTATVQLEGFGVKGLQLCSAPRPVQPEENAP